MHSRLFDRTISWFQEPWIGYQMSVFKQLMIENMVIRVIASTGLRYPFYKIKDAFFTPYELVSQTLSIAPKNKKRVDRISLQGWPHRG